MSKKSVTPSETKHIFVNPDTDKYLNPVEYCNNNLSWETVLSGDKNISVDEDTITFHLQGGEVESLPLSTTYLVIPDRALTKLPPRHPLSKFTCLSILKFKGNFNACMSFVTLKYQSKEIPYIRVGTDYFKVIYKKDRYGLPRRTIKAWKKETITLDHTSSILTHIARFDDFCIEPDNVHFEQMIENLYNLYAEFTHKPHPTPVTTDQIPASLTLIHHIFGEQYEMGLQYMKVLYQCPRQALPVLSLLSSERETGKTTFINWLNMIFGDNYVQIGPEDLGKAFNSHYASKNIIAIDETLIEKTAAGEKLKSLATAKSITVDHKFVANYMLPFFAKIILCTNKVLDFMRIDDEEIRFWVRRVPHITKKNTTMEEQLAQEIPMFLRYILDCVPMPDFSQSRMVFTAGQISNQYLDQVKEESRSTLYKELSIAFTNLFNEWTTYTEFHCTPTDIKKKFFASEHNISASYIHKVLRDEFKLTPNANSRYRPFNADMPGSVVGKYFIIPRDLFLKNEELFNDEPPF